MWCQVIGLALRSVDSCKGAKIVEPNLLSHDAVVSWPLIKLLSRLDQLSATKGLVPLFAATLNYCSIFSFGVFTYSFIYMCVCVCVCVCVCMHACMCAHVCVCV